MWKIPLFDLNYDTLESAAVLEVIGSKWLTMGEQVIALERSFAQMLGGSVECHAVTNCTAALHMAVLAAGVRPGDEVIIPALTFVADANVVRMVGAQPVLADICSDSDLNVSVSDIERKISSRTRAVIVVHFAGYPCDMEPIVDLCRRRGIRLIEDVAHAPGATYKGRPLGSIGDFGCFSFFSNKNISTGEGGLVCARDPDLARALKHLRSHGMSSATLDRHNGRAYSYDVEEPGLNYRIDEIRAALGRVQLNKLEEANRRREQLTLRYRERLAGTEMTVPFEGSRESRPAFHIMPILLPQGCPRERVMQRLKHDGIQSSIHYPPFWSFSAYSMFTPDDARVLASVADRELTLPLYPSMTVDQVDLACERLVAAVTDA